MNGLLATTSRKTMLEGAQICVIYMYIYMLFYNFSSFHRCTVFMTYLKTSAFVNAFSIFFVLLIKLQKRGSMTYLSIYMCLSIYLYVHKHVCFTTFHEFIGACYFDCFSLQSLSC